MPESRPVARYRWYILALSAVTSTLVIAMPFSCMPALFPEISEDIGLSLVEIGTVWGTASLAGVFVSLAAGLLCDRFGVKRILVISCILMGLTGALRGLSDDFLSLTATVFLNGLTRAIIPVIITKMIGIWFKERNLAMANGIGAMGMGLGLMLGPMISATVLSPALGGWRYVLYLYGAIGVFIAILWLIFGREPVREGQSPDCPKPALRVKDSLLSVMRIKALWLLGLIIMFRSGSTMGMVGYLPLYLRDRGFSDALADNTLTVFFAASTICVIPLSLLSDRIGNRKLILFISLAATVISIALIPLVNGAMIFVLMGLSGVFFDGFMAIACALLLETQGVSPDNSGIALGLVFTIGMVGGVVSPPIGNGLAELGQGLPFYFWAGLSVLSIIILLWCKETGKRSARVTPAG